MIGTRGINAMHAATLQPPDVAAQSSSSNHPGLPNAVARVPAVAAVWPGAPSPHGHWSHLGDASVNRHATSLEAAVRGVAAHATALDQGAEGHEASERREERASGGGQEMTG
jgi:hypothetical protein